ncbi:MAG: hypothetical protein A2Y21_01860 [Clostridiales bacterium GWC2_40_7]|nr:MAG: hypothetical protein A2Y21_01860 [Clostridiales bacterium GWC2_40_7]
MNSDIILNKVQTIHRCIKRINEEYLSGSDSLSDYTRQDSIILNILRACETSIDLAMHIVSERCLEVPQNSRDAFEIIFRNGIIDKQLEQKLKAMVGFRNIAVHDYQAISIEIVKGIVENHLDDFREFADIVMRL